MASKKACPSPTSSFLRSFRIRSRLNSESLFEFYYTLSEPDGGTGGEGAPMVYAYNVKDWNNLVLTKAFLDLLGEDPDDVRHALNCLPQKPDEDILPEGSTGYPKYLNKYPGKTGDNPQDNDICSDT